LKLGTISLAALTWASILGSAALSRADVIVSEDFSYADGGVNGQTGGTGFSNAWTSSTDVTDGVSTGNSASTRSLAFDNLLIGTTVADVDAIAQAATWFSGGAMAALDFTGQSHVTQLTPGGSVRAEGSYGSSKSSATNKNDSNFSGTGVINVIATIDHVAMATGNMTAADAAWTAGNWAAVRGALSKVFTDLRLTSQWRSIAHLRYARSFQAAGDFANASAIFGAIAATGEYPRIHQIEGAECKAECDRLARGLPGRDPEASRVRVPAAPTPGRVLYVAPNGNDANPGTRAQPFASVNQALAANRAAGAVAGGTTILMAAGRYPLADTIALTSADSGPGADAPLSIRAATPGTAVISGGKRLTGFTAVTDKSVLARLPLEARGKVMQCDLPALGITDYGSIQEQPMVNLSVNGVPQTLARWPNSGFVRVGDMVDSGNIDHEDPKKNRPQVFTWSGDRPSRWTTAPDAWLQGYLATNWLYGSVRVGSINPQAKTITTAWCYNRLSGWPDIKSGNPYAVFNLLEETDQPGEWYLDRANGMLYLYPSAIPGKAVVDLSMLSGPMLTVTNASHVRIEGLVFECSRGTGVELENSNNCLIAGCTVRNVSGIGVNINGGQRNSMIGCNLHDLEHAACHINGGDIDTLTPGGHLVANCRFRNFGRTSRSAGISLNGVGHRITHCVFEDCPSSAIGFAGFNFLVEYNEFRNCCNEIDDYGVIYAWGNPTWRGNIWRFNKFSHCGGGYTQGWVQNRYFGTSAFRFDDAVSGQTVYGNVFTHFDQWGTSAGVMGNNTGRDNIYDNNLVTDSRGVNYGYFDAGNHMYKQGLPNGVSPVHLAAFPELANLFDGKGQNFIWRSTLLRVSAAGTNAKNSNYADNEWGNWQYIANTNTGTDPGFVDGVEVKKTIDPTLFWNLGMRAIPVDEIGLYNDPTRVGWRDNSGMALDHSGNRTAVFAEPGGTITLAAPLSADGLTFTAPGYTLAGTRPIIINAPMTTIDAKHFGATISAPLTGLGGISVAGTGTLTLSGSNTYNGSTTVKTGTLALGGGDNRLPPGTTVTLGGGGPAAVGTLKLNGCNQELAGLWTAGHNSDAGNRLINGSATTCTLTLNIEHSRNNQFAGTLGGTGQDENNFAVRKTGGGALWLNRSITWTGGTTIEAGSLELNSSFWQGNQASGTFRIGKGATFAVSGQVSPLTFNNVTVEFLSGGGGTLVNRGSSEWLTWMVEGGMTIRSTGGERNLFSAAPNHGLSLNGKNLLCDIARGTDATCDLLVSIPLTGDGSITKQGNGIMTLSGANSYSGATEVNAGTLVVDAAGTLGTGNLTVANGATCGLRNTAGAVADNAAVTLNGTGRLILASGVSETVGMLVIDGIQRPRGVWNAAKDPVHFAGSGSLIVTSGPFKASAGADGVIGLAAADATLEGHGLKLENQNGASYIGYWTNPADSVSFLVRFEKAGVQTIGIEWACPDAAAGSKTEFRLFDKDKHQVAALPWTVAATGSWEKFETAAVGGIHVPAAGNFTLRLVALDKPGEGVANLKTIRLTPAKRGVLPRKSD
jgi:autotransporter-associated beta strand protein